MARRSSRGRRGRNNSGGYRSRRASGRSGYRARGRGSRGGGQHTVKIVVQSGDAQPGGPVTPEALRAAFIGHSAPAPKKAQF